MNSVDALFLAVSQFLSLDAVILILVGTIIALLLGLLPGLSGTEAMLILLPFTYSMNLEDTMILMVTAYAAAFVGGAATSILIGIPGCSTTICTTFDGNALTRKGQAYLALGVAATSSVWGGIVSILLIVILMPFMVPFSLLFGPPEWFAFVVFGLIIMAMTDDGKFYRAILSGVFGLLLSCTGLSLITGDVRFTFGSTYLWGGISIIPAFIGIYPLAEVVDLTFLGKMNLKKGVSFGKPGDYWKQVCQGIIAGTTRIKALSIGTLIGWVIGIIPGVGGTLANMMGYVLVKETSREKDSFGKGNVEGIIGAESANNASVGGALIPALALGIPGSVNTAILLGIFMLHGIQPGTNIFESNLDVTWVIIIAGAIGTILGSVFILGIGWRLSSFLYKLDMTVIVPIVVIIGTIAAYMNTKNIMDVVAAYVLAFVGYAMKKYGYSRLAFVIALMLGPLLEKSFFQAINIGRGSYSVFIKSPTIIILWALVLIALFGVIWRNKKSMAVNE